jgi:CDP-glycerol glycerophosphotransferase (TagB/SpsB family)
VFGTNIIDATSHPLLNDLLLVADIVITDYSSIMFDYTVTGKPIQFFVPDYDDYRDRRRGLYFDLAASAPGPVLFNREDLVESLRSADRLHAEHADAYAAWVAKFNPRDDGQAAARVVDVVFGE